MYKKLLFITIFISVLLSNTILAKEQKPKEKSGSAIFVMAIPKEIKVETKMIHYTDEYVNIEMKLPQIKGLENKKFEKIINKYFNTHATTLKKNIIKQAREYQGPKSDSGLSNITFELISNYTIKETIPNCFTIGIFEYSYTGGAHGIGKQKYITIDLSSNKILTLKDLFIKNSNYQEAIHDNLKKQVDERIQEGEHFCNQKENSLLITDNQTFYINSKGDIVIVFNIYEIAPYTAGIIEFTVPYKVIKPYLKSVTK